MAPASSSVQWEQLWPTMQCLMLQYPCVSLTPATPASAHLSVETRHALCLPGSVLTVSGAWTFGAIGTSWRTNFRACLPASPLPPALPAAGLPTVPRCSHQQIFTEHLLGADSKRSPGDAVSDRSLCQRQETKTRQCQAARSAMGATVWTRSCQQGAESG